jgi:prepilin-type N-terminal cleavage/methylation domain-containing protein/prepilin-type processing-associated H-X9-DG protein
MIRSSQNRGGFTLVEMLVVLAIIGILMALSVGAAMRMREAARRADCAHRMGQVGLAIHNFENSHDRLPGYLESMGRFAGGQDPADPASFGGNVPAHEKLATWQAVILGHVGNQPLYERWSMDRYPLRSNGGVFPSAPGGYAGFSAANVETYICPSATTNRGPGANHWVANTGLHPTNPPQTYTRGSNGTGQGAPTGQGVPGTITITLARSQSKANGVFQNRYEGFLTPSSSDLTPVGKDFKNDDFHDGRSQTIMVSENLNARPWHQVSFSPADFLSSTRTIGSKSVVQYPFESRYVSGMLWHFADASGIAGAGPVSPLVKINGGDAPNLEMNASEFTSLARPSSNHDAGVNVLFADGSVMFLNDAVDYRIFQSWMTPHTTRSDMPMNEFIVTEAF